jgi:peptidoglycan/LPS O-acetylase OafA/YrhL
VLTLLEALVVLGFAVFYVYEMVTGATDDLTRAATSGALILVFGLALLALARGWGRAAQWARTPTVLWNVLLLPVAWSLRESDRTDVAVAVGLVAVASIVAALASPGRRDEGDDTDSGPDSEADVVS